MRLLLDTHILLWWLDDSSKLSDQARALISDASNVVVVSAASVWEIRVKESLGKLHLPASFAEALDKEPFERLPVTLEHAHRLKGLPPHHRDPFDRMLIVQAQCEYLTLVTADEILRQYDVDSRLV
ncbi:MAG: type II toxin-antitoxin system VapC family toxin [Candidatus Wallbacteria bacterium]|nr:type II toxin-antitoxin system VapC family toxin [Candidatus Wallbacteria bacterium]